MDTFHKSLEQILEEQINVKTIIRKVFREKCEKLGIEVKEQKLNELIDLMESQIGKETVFNFDDDDIINLKKVNTDDIQIEINDEDIIQTQNKLLKLLPDIFERSSESAATDLLKVLREDFINIRQAQQKEQDKFNVLVWKYWKKPLGLLEVFIVLTIEYGTEFNNHYGKRAKNSNDQVFEVLFSLFARSCQVASEILVLLKYGFADGAHARWRTLHEIAIVAQFIDKHGATTAERYEAHACIEDYKGAKQRQEYCKINGWKPMSYKELAQLKADRDAVVKKYGQNFSGSYGWAAFALNKNNPTFSDIEKDVGLDKWRPIYKLASHNVHANPMGLAVKLGRLPEDNSKLLIGQSLLGLDEAGHGTALSLMKIIVALLFRKTNLDAVIYSKILMKLEREIGQEFNNVAKKLFFV